MTLPAVAVNCRVWLPVPVIPRSPNRATPEASVVAVVLPSSVPLPDARLAVTSTPEAGPELVVTWMTGCTLGSNTSPVSADTGGLVVITTPPPEPAPSVIVLETAGRWPGALKLKV